MQINWNDKTTFSKPDVLISNKTYVLENQKYIDKATYKNVIPLRSRLHFIQVEVNNETKIGVPPFHLILPTTWKPTWKLADFWISVLTTFN